MIIRDFFNDRTKVVKNDLLEKSKETGDIKCQF
jgi:hypothetical protein